MDWFAADARRRGMTLTRYLASAGIVGSWRRRQIAEHEAYGLDLDGGIDCD